MPSSWSQSLTARCGVHYSQPRGLPGTATEGRMPPRPAPALTGGDSRAPGPGAGRTPRLALSTANSPAGRTASGKNGPKKSPNPLRIRSVGRARNPENDLWAGSSRSITRP